MSARKHAGNPSQFWYWLGSRPAAANGQNQTDTAHLGPVSLPSSRWYWTCSDCDHRDL